MRGHIGKRAARSAWMLAAMLCIAQSALAKPGGEPLVLDTETGIHSGAPGTVLQTAPLNSSGMVQMDTLSGPPQQEQPPILVSPYVEYGSGQSVAPSGNGGGSYRVPRQPNSR
jgi:hypothetical protein